MSGKVALMKATSLSLLLFLVTATALVAFPSPQDVFKGVEQNIQKSDVNALSSYFANSVELTIEEREGTYSKSQAQVVIKNFFNKTSPFRFELRHNGSSGPKDKYAIGILTASDGTTYRTFISLRMNENGYEVQEIRFEKS